MQTDLSEGKYKLLTIKDLAELTGKSEATIWHWRYTKGLPVTQIGQSIYVKESDFNQWLEDRKPKQKFILDIPPRGPRESKPFEGITRYDYWGNPVKAKAARSAKRTTLESASTHEVLNTKN